MKLKTSELKRLTIPEYHNIKKLPIIILLDNVRSMANVGSIFRTSDAFAIEQIILTGISAQPPHREIEKTALGATESVKWQYLQRSLEAVQHFKQNGYKILALEQTTNSITLNEFSTDTTEKILLIVGNEVDGVSNDILELCDVIIEIPQWGTKHSLNVVVATGIALWDICAKKILNY